MKRICLALACFSIYLKAFPQIAPILTGETYLASLFDNSVRFDTAAPLPLVKTDPAFDVENAWKSWKIVDNFTYGKDRGSLPMIADLNALHPYFRDRIKELFKACKAQGIELAIVETFRTHAKQAEYFGMGRKYTRSKGGKSKHQYGLAVDVVPIVNNLPVWDNVRLWKKIGLTGERLGLRWGGRWKAPFDPAHFEWTGGTTTYQLAGGETPKIPLSKVMLYPTLNDELVLLQKYWEAWEVEQASMARSSKSKKLAATSAPLP